MALTAIQRDVCRLLADRRRAAGDSYVAGGVALSVALETHRLSRDLDVFHDTTDAVARSWDADRAALDGAGYAVTVLRERPGFVEAIVARHDDRLIIEWARDSAFRFFPLVEHDVLGLTLHRFDLATNKVLALVGRLEPRDWVDVMSCDDRVQPLGYLAWAACGKDPGFSPQGILEHARSTHYVEDELSALAFVGNPPSARELSIRWHESLRVAEAMVARLPAEWAGQAVLGADGELFTGGIADLERALSARGLTYHRGRVGGAMPRLTG